MLRWNVVSSEAGRVLLTGPLEARSIANSTPEAFTFCQSMAPWA